jgi:hypothetical protein
MPALAALSTRIVVEEQAARRPMTVVIAPVADTVVAETASDISALAEPVVEVVILPSIEPGSRSEAPVRFVAVPAGA